MLRGVWELKIYDERMRNVMKVFDWSTRVEEAKPISHLPRTKRHLASRAKSATSRRMSKRRPGGARACLAVIPEASPRRPEPLVSGRG